MQDADDDLQVWTGEQTFRFLAFVDDPRGGPCGTWRWAPAPAAASRSDCVGGMSTWTHTRFVSVGR